MISTIYNSTSKVLGKVIETVSPKPGQKVGLLTDAAAVAVTAIAATYAGPLLAAQIAGTYLLGRYIHNETAKEPKLEFVKAPAKRSPAPQQQRQVQAPNDDWKGHGERLIDGNPEPVNWNAELFNRMATAQTLTGPQKDAFANFLLEFDTVTGIDGLRAKALSSATLGMHKAAFLTFLDRSSQLR